MTLVSFVIGDDDEILMQTEMDNVPREGDYVALKDTEARVSKVTWMTGAPSIDPPVESAVVTLSPQ